MVHLLVRLEVNDYSSWRSHFDAALDWRHKAGECSCRIFHTAGNLNHLTLLFEWDSSESAKRFSDSPELRERMAKSGVKGQPTFEILTEMYTVRRSAAD